MNAIVDRFLEDVAAAIDRGDVDNRRGQWSPTPALLAALAS